MNRKSAALAAVVTAAAGFFAGVEIEKSQLSTSATAATSPGATTGAGAAAGSGASAGAGAGARGGFPFGGRGGGGGAGANASFGTVSSVSGNTIYLTEPSGNTVKVTLSSATKITKSQAATKSSLRPGDSVVVQGISSNGGTTATSVSDSGARAAG